MTQITLNGHDVKVAFNMATLLAYEQLTDKAFVPSEIFPSDGEPKQSDLVEVALAALIANNPSEDSDLLLQCESHDEVLEFIAATITEMMRWYKIRPIQENHVPEPPKDDEEEEEKKA